MKISIIIPAYNEEQYITRTLEVISQEDAEIIVIDDGSSDNTADLALKGGAMVLKNQINLGKGKSLEKGIQHASGDLIVFLDADLGKSAIEYKKLVQCVEENRCDMAVAVFGEGNSKGFGLVKGIANLALYLKYRKIFKAPLSGQRALKAKTIKNLMPFSPDFGVEVGLTIKALKKGYKIMEVPTSMSHRQTSKNIEGFLHRSKQLNNILRAIMTSSRVE